MSPTFRRRGPRPQVLLAALVTAVVVPFLVIDALDDDGGDAPVEVRGATEERSPAEASTTTVPSGPTSTTVPTVTIDISWLPKGTSSYGETDDETQARIDRRRGLVAAKLPPPTTTTTTLDPRAASSSTTTTSPRRAPSTTTPSATAAPPPEPTTTVAPAPPATDPPPPPPAAGAAAGG